MRFEIASADKAELIFVRCVQTMVTVQLPGGRPQRVPKAWRERIRGCKGKGKRV